MKRIMFAMSLLLLVSGTAVAQESLPQSSTQKSAVNGLFTLTNEIGSNFRGSDNFLFTYNYVVTPGLRFRNDMTLSLPISGGINGTPIENSQYYGAFSFTPNLKIGLKLGYDVLFDDNSVMSVGAVFGGTVFAIDYKSLYYDINISFGDAGYGSNQVYGFGLRYYQGIGDAKNYFCLYASFGIRIK